MYVWVDAEVAFTIVFGTVMASLVPDRILVVPPAAVGVTPGARTFTTPAVAVTAAAVPKFAAHAEVAVALAWNCTKVDPETNLVVAVVIVSVLVPPAGPVVALRVPATLAALATGAATTPAAAAARVRAATAPNVVRRVRVVVRMVSPP